MKKFNDAFKLEDFISYFFLNVLLFFAISAFFSLFKWNFEIINIWKYAILAAFLFLIDTVLLFGLFYFFRYLFRKKISSARFETTISLVIFGLIFILDVALFIRVLGINANFVDSFSYDSNNYSNACIMVGSTKIIEAFLFEVIKRLKGEKI